MAQLYQIRSVDRFDGNQGNGNYKLSDTLSVNSPVEFSRIVLPDNATATVEAPYTGQIWSGVQANKLEIQLQRSSAGPPPPDQFALFLQANPQPFVDTRFPVPTNQMTLPQYTAVGAQILTAAGLNIGNNPISLAGYGITIAYNAASFPLPIFRINATHSDTFPVTVRVIWSHPNCDSSYILYNNYSRIDPPLATDALLDLTVFGKLDGSVNTVPKSLGFIFGDSLNQSPNVLTTAINETTATTTIPIIPYTFPPISLITLWEQDLSPQHDVTLNINAQAFTVRVVNMDVPNDIYVMTGEWELYFVGQ